MKDTILSKKKPLTLKQLKVKMLAYRDLFGGEIVDTERIKKSTSRQELLDIVDEHIDFIEMLANDATRHLEKFKHNLQ